MPKTKAVQNWRLLESELVSALRRDGWHITKNAVGDPCVGDLNIARLAQRYTALAPDRFAKFWED